MQKIYLGLGSNRGDRLAFIESAVDNISRIDSTSLLRVSAVYETEPWGIRDQNFFLNCVTEITTGLDAHAISGRLKEVEKLIGRTNSSKWHEREIDIDLLFYGDMIVNSNNLRVPHAEVENRKFVLVPLNEIVPELVHPVSGKTIAEFLEASKDNLEVNLFGRLSLSNSIH
ncbi:MAG: 2-amino-4-hydroxy-6-hydroxymethyldihydropteridine diphosphokinase [Ignavibacteria bacterium]|nr:2-amino-4-hydroxy-6-hydroxymethyldihydropteridine diphosphokinase [Ignavibacteria bacterium]